MNDPNQNRNRHRDKKPRKNRERRVTEERKVIANKPARDRRWKEKYVAGELEDDETLLDGDDLFLSEDDSDEGPSGQ